MTSVSSLISPVLDQYICLLQLEIEESPYLFSKDPTRCQTSSVWSAYCKVKPSPFALPRSQMPVFDPLVVCVAVNLWEVERRILSTENVAGEVV